LDPVGVLEVPLDFIGISFGTWHSYINPMLFSKFHRLINISVRNLA
jgi:hypothetical protein